MTLTFVYLWSVNICSILSLKQMVEERTPHLLMDVLGRSRHILCNTNSWLSIYAIQYIEVLSVVSKGQEVSKNAASSMNYH